MASPLKDPQPILQGSVPAVLTTPHDPAKPVSATPHSDPAQPASPVAQLTPALITLAAAPSGASRQVIIRLDPAELGQVQLRITHAGASAAPQVEIAVERPATLHLLVQDRERLEQALDRAGVPAEGRTVQFTLAPADSDAPSLTPSAPGSSPSTATSTQSGAQQDTPRQQQGQPDTPQQSGYRARFLATDEDTALPAWIRSARAGVDITA